MDTEASSENLLDTLKTPNTDTVVVDDDAPEPQLTELDMLKNRAKLMGIVFSNNIGLESLKAKVQAKIDGETVAPTAAPVVPETIPAAPVAKTLQQIRDEMHLDQMRLVRLRITNLNPAKKDLPGEIITFANRILGSVKKFIPFGEQTENGYHVPYCIYQILKDREFVSIKSRKDSKGRVTIEHSMAREFALEVLDPLTDLERARLQAAQAAAAGND